MNAFDIAAILAVIAATSGYINHRFLRLPATSGTLVVALVSSLAVLAADLVFSELKLVDAAATFLSSIDFNETLMHGMLSFLLFAAALHVDLEGLLANKWTIGALSTVGVLLSTAVVGLLTWWTFLLVGISVPLLVCVAFGGLTFWDAPLMMRAASALSAGVRRWTRHHLRPGLLPCSAKGCAIFNAREKVSAYEVFDVTDTVTPCSGNVMRDATIPPSESPSWPTVRVCLPASATVSRSQPRP